MAMLATAAAAPVCLRSTQAPAQADRSRINTGKPEPCHSTPTSTRWCQQAHPDPACYHVNYQLLRTPPYGHAAVLLESGMIKMVQ
jgi:hypothetical protein